MHTKGRLSNAIFWALRPEGATLAILVLLLFLLFFFLFMTFTAQPAQGQVAQNTVPPTAWQAAASPEFAQRLAHRRTTPAAPLARRHAAPQDTVLLYENGPVNGNTYAWTINFGYVVADSFTLGVGRINGFDFWVWEFPGDSLSSVDWSITSAPFGGTTYASGTASGSNLTDKFISSNSYGYDIDAASASGLNVSLGAGTYYLNLQNAVVPSGDQVYWDENSGTGCHSSGCPSLADESSVGTNSFRSLRHQWQQYQPTAASPLL
jgi:hypothetical protein